MPEWIYFIHPPREDFAATMTDAEKQVWGEHAQRLEPAAALGQAEPDGQDDARQADGRAVEPVAVLDEDAPGGVPEVIQEHIDAERRRPVGDGHADAVDGDGAADQQQGPGERRGAEGDAVRVTDPRTVARLAKAWADQGWPAEPDDSGSGITAPFNAPSQGPPPWNVYRIEPRSATVALGTEPGGLTRFRF